MVGTVTVNTILTVSLNTFYACIIIRAKSPVTSSRMTRPSICAHLHYNVDLRRQVRMTLRYRKESRGIDLNIFFLRIEYRERK